MHTRRREHFGAVVPCSILDSCYTNIKMKSLQLIWLNIVGLYNFHTIVVIEYFFYAGSLKGWIERPAKTTCAHAALWLAGFIVCQCWSSSVKHLDFPTSHPVSSLYLSSKALYWRQDSRDTYLRISVLTRNLNRLKSFEVIKCERERQTRFLSCTPCPWNLSVVPPQNDREYCKSGLFSVQCNSLVLFCAMWSHLSHHLSMLMGNTKSRSAKQRNLSDYTLTFTHRETYTSKCPPSPFCGTVYELVCPLLMTMGCGDQGGVFWIWKGTMKAVCTVFSFC